MKLAFGRSSIRLRGVGPPPGAEVNRFLWFRVVTPAFALQRREGWGSVVVWEAQCGPSSLGFRENPGVLSAVSQSVARGLPTSGSPGCCLQIYPAGTKAEHVREEWAWRTALYKSKCSVVFLLNLKSRCSNPEAHFPSPPPPGHLVVPIKRCSGCSGWLTPVMHGEDGSINLKTSRSFGLSVVWGSCVSSREKCL